MKAGDRVGMDERMWPALASLLGKPKIRVTQPVANPYFIYRTGNIRFNLAFVERKISAIIQTLRLAKKTSKEDYTQHLRLVALGLGVVGAIGFFIKLIAELITMVMNGG